MSSKPTFNCIHWFRHGLRLSDMPSLYQAAKVCQKIYPIFIFDGFTAGLKQAGFNRTRYLLDCLADLDTQFKSFGGRLICFHGNCVQILESLIKKWSITHISFEQDPEPIWKERDDLVKQLANSLGVEIIEKISHTLWDPEKVIDMNGGEAPSNYEMFCHTVNVIGQPDRPLPKPDFTQLKTIFPLDDYCEDTAGVPSSPLVLGVKMESEKQINQVWFGGETISMELLADRLSLEKSAFKVGDYLPTQSTPDITITDKSLSPALRHGCLSVRKFYWDLHDLYESIFGNSVKPRIVGQLIWREFFYTMSVNNPCYGQMANNPVCLQIKWKQDSAALEAWSTGKTGYPFIDAAMRQLIFEGWIHHAVRNAVACFLTRGDLWLSWEHGLKVFLKYLIDADWSVCAGNWMWVSSSAFDTILQSDACISPIMYGRWLEPTAPIEVQKEANCIIGVDYPEPIINHDVAFKTNQKLMESVKNVFLDHRYQSMSNFKHIPNHVAPSNIEETKAFLCLPEDFFNNLVI
ncbi:cryptochrome-1 isoform X2 [Tetranychus urticae]|uniref:cryptochrome-1 isoform X2 n=1 Tax=Tetranychus urticae TaxID=32264 RepID=UPI000D658F20|nr:cryptochrome-1 isoform X2 [Tetranychus urticae]